MRFQHPIKCIRRFGCVNAGQRELLAASAGPKIIFFDATTGSKLSSWPSDPAPGDPAGAAVSSLSEAADAGGFEPPEKRRKLSSSPSAEATGKPGDYKAASKAATKSAAPQWTSISILVVTKTGNHVIAVTTEDKCVRVFEVTKDGALLQLSERPMPKKPCAVRLAENDTVILVGDKFGDVYSFPLFPTSEPVQPRKKKAEPKQFQPAASALTVHTKRNLQALDQQLRFGKPKAPEKPEPTFKKTLLLGHVSMLTDVALVSLPLGSGSNASYDYILTSDRDEHIRVSRGSPQTHIIEGYCLGHTSFITKLSVPHWDLKTLISGGGDNFILVWDWLERRVRQRVELGYVFESKEQEDISQTTVSGIWTVPFGDRTDLHGKGQGVVLVALEGVPKLLSFVFDKERKLVPQNPIELTGNALDVTSIDDSCRILISVDNVHEPGSTKTRRNTTSASQRLVHALTPAVGQSGLNWKESSSKAVDAINEHGTTNMPVFENEKEASKQVQALAESLYSLSNLRKREQGEDE